MFRRGLLFRLIGLLLILALLGAGGSMLFRSGFNQGYLAGSLAAGAEGGTQVLPTLPYGMAPYGWFGHGYGYGFSPIGPILGLLFFGGLMLLFFGLFSRPFRHGPLGRWQSEGGPHWGPGSWEGRWEERMKAWQQAHEGAQGENKPEAHKETDEAVAE